VRHDGYVDNQGDTVIRLDWDQDNDDIWYGDDDLLEYRGEPFTGEIVKMGADHMLSQDFFTNGVPNGTNREWWPDGGLRFEGLVRYGRAYGDHRTWHKNGRLAEVKHFGDTSSLTGVEEWDEDGNPKRR